MPSSVKNPLPGRTTDAAGGVLRGGGLQSHTHVAARSAGPLRASATRRRAS